MMWSKGSGDGRAGSSSFAEAAASRSAMFSTSRPCHAILKAEFSTIAQICWLGINERLLVHGFHIWLLAVEQKTRFGQ